MSIVGTRPPLISETNLYEPRHKVMLCSISDCRLHGGRGEEDYRSVFCFKRCRSYGGFYKSA